MWVVEVDESAKVKEVAMILTLDISIYSEGGCFCPKLETIY